MSRLASLLAAVPEPLTDLAGTLTAVGVIIGSIWTAGYDGSGRGVIEWDLGRPFDAPGQPHGAVAAGIPHMPHFIRCDELARREVRHAAFLALPNYAPDRQAQKAAQRAAEQEGLPPVDTYDGPAEDEQKDEQEDSVADLRDLTVAELQDLAAEHDIDGRSSMNKADLVAALDAVLD